jgi:hypothetical protein
MSDAKFTPGPWKLNGECWSSNGHYEAPQVFSYANPDAPQFVAEIAVRDLWEENGNLIAAAPRLYRALQVALDLILEQYGRAALAEGYWPTVKPLVAQIDAALASVEGKC